MDKLDDTWNSRDLPVLREAVRGVDESFTGRRAHEIADATGLTTDTVLLALRALEADGLVEVKWVMPGHAARAVRVSGDARREVGTWPTPEGGFDRMIAALEAIAANTDDDDTRTRARRILDGFAGAGRQIGIATVTAVVTGQIPS